jgi:hypothetical protein
MGLAILTQGLLMIVGAEAFSCTEINELSVRGHVVGRLPVDIPTARTIDCPRHDSLAFDLYFDRSVRPRTFGLTTENRY